MRVGEFTFQSILRPLSYLRIRALRTQKWLVGTESADRRRSKSYLSRELPVYKGQLAPVGSLL